MKVAIIGITGAIGQAFYDYYIQDPQTTAIYGFSRNRPSYDLASGQWASLDLTVETSIQAAAELVAGQDIDRLIVATGMLHSPTHSPEKSLDKLNAQGMLESYKINAIGPALILKYFLPHLNKKNLSHCALLSARVGSIGDNHLGGWYSYRMSKVALNMLIKSASIEWQRRAPQSIIIGLHPGTVDSSLSKPFQANINHTIFTPDQAVLALTKVLDALTPEDSGNCYAYDGSLIPA